MQTIGADNCTIRNSLFNNSASGVVLWNLNQSSFSNNIITNVTQGDAVVLGGLFSTIMENTIFNNNRGYGGLHVMGDHNLIAANEILNNTYGIKIDSSNNNNVSSNEIEDNSASQLELFNSSFNTISGNRIVGKMSDFPGRMGLLLSYNSNNNTVIENFIENNSYGIYVDRSENNSIFHNNIVNNDVQAHVLNPSAGQATHIYSNVWDDGYPSGGNHWSDYTDVDSNHDGIGDTLYGISDDNIDNYPLMNPYVVPEFYYMMYLPLFVFSTLAAAAIQKRKKKA